MIIFIRSNICLKKYGNMSESRAKITNKSMHFIKCLTACEINTEFIVVRVNTGLMAKRRLANLGIVPGVKIIKKRAAPIRGPVEIIVKGSSLVIGRGLAAKITVKSEETYAL